MRHAARLGCLILGIVLESRASPAAPDAITRVEVHKAPHLMQLFAGETEVARYNVWIGPGGRGVKRREGDQVTPVGHYHVSRRSPSAHYDIFLGIDYPNSADRARFADAKASGALPDGATIGGDVGIHGGSPETWEAVSDGEDWTLGCVSVRNSEIERIARVVRVGTPVEISDD
jgi:murein L,D-transpeptidase YafK